MKILVTGATGFIGQNLIKSLIEKGYIVHILVRENSDISMMDKSINIFRYNENIDTLIALFEKEKFDGVVHLASLFLASHNSSDISNLIYSNIKFGTELLEAAKISNVEWFINTGTFWQNYENSDYNPVNLYSATKEAFENIAKFYVETSEIIFTTIKLNDTFGPNDTRNKVFNLWNKIAKTGERLDMSAGDQIIDISYIKDVVSAYTVMIDNLNQKDKNIHKNKTYVIANNEVISLQQLSKIFEKVTKTTLNINWGGRDYRDREVMKPYSLGKTVPNWEQKFKLEDAIKNTIKDINND